MSKTYTDNAMNRKLGRVGQLKGTMPQSGGATHQSSSASYENVYVDNAQNRRIGRVGQPKGTMPLSEGATYQSSSASDANVYVDNAQNRRIGRVGQPKGTMPRSGGATHQSSSASDANVYVDNAQNRRIGRVGQPKGTMPQSGGATHQSSSARDANVYVDNAQNRRIERVGQQHGTAVMPSTTRNNNIHPAARGNNTPPAARESNTRPAARGNNTPSRRQSRTPVENEISSTSTTKTYVDNAKNRQLDRVGLPHGTAVESATHRRSHKPQSGYPNESISRPNEVSKYGNSPTSTIKPRCSLLGADRGRNNASPVLHEIHDSSTLRLSNDSVTRIKTKHCTRENRDTRNYTGSSTKAPNLYDDLACGEHREEGHLHTRTPSISFSELKDDDKAANRGKPKTEKRYVDNYYNRTNDRVGLLHGEAVISRKDVARGDCPKANAGEVEAVVHKKDQPNAEFTKRYTNNSQNRKLGRVGMPHGTMVYSQKTNDITRRVYADTPLNRHLGRAGKPLGSMPRKSIVTYKIPEIIEKLRTNQMSETADDDDIPDGIFESKNPSRTALRQAICYHNRQQAERSWQRAFKEPPKTEMSILEDYNGKKIDFNELKLHVRIGRGGFGEVYFAKWHETVVAVKMLRTEKFTDRNIVTFAEEVKKFCELDHPNIVKFIGACTEVPDVCIVMEYMQYSLYDAIHVHKLNFNDDDILSITQQVCKGIMYLHGRRIAHCDIKTANILMDYVENQICEAKITDFGLSMMMQNTTQSLPGDEFVCHRGTPRYSAPEILRGDILCLRDMIHTDVYSLGLVLFEIIFFEEPFHDLSSVQMRHQVGENGVKPEISNDVMVDEDVLGIIHKTWQFEPHLRPNAREISDVMNRTLSIFVDTEF